MVIVACLFSAFAGGCTGPAAWTQLEDFAGGRVRAVWLADAGDGKDVFATGNNLLLMGMDSRDGRVERRILAEPGGYFKPLLAPGGDKIIFTDTSRQTVRVVDFDGKNLKDLLPGVALAAWRDPADGTDWIFIRSGPVKSNSGPVVKVRMDHPAACSTVWSLTPVDSDNFQVSADGQWAGGLFPWPKCAAIACGAELISLVAQGCWTSFSPDNSRILWHLDGDHRSIVLYDCKLVPAWQGGREIRLDQAPGIGGREVYHPRWSNNPRFMAMTGPYSPTGHGGNTKAGSPAVEIYIGRFNVDLTAVEKWIRLTNNKVADYYPDVWAASSFRSLASRPAQTQTAPDDSTGDDEITVEAELVYRPVVPDPSAIDKYTQALAADMWQVRRIISGRLADDLILVAQWAIRDRKKIPMEFQVGQVKVIKLVKYSKVPELKGQRRLLEPWQASSGLTIFYLRPK